MWDTNAIEAINELFANVGNARSYSGRGMYGKTCLGVTVSDNVGSFVADALRQAVSDDLSLEVLADVLEDMRSDSMGRDTIYYFPDIPFIRDETEKDED